MDLDFTSLASSYSDFGYWCRSSISIVDVEMMLGVRVGLNEDCFCCSLHRTSGYTCKPTGTSQDYS